MFAHAAGELKNDSEQMTEKLQRIRLIRSRGFEVAHVIHRHGMDEVTAFEVEAALMDAYPGITNLVRGQSSSEYGLMHSKGIIERYAAPEAVFSHKALLINVNRSATVEESVYEAARYAWKVDRKKAESAELVLAVQQGLILGVFIAEKWLPATPENFPSLTSEIPKRWGFVGIEAPKSVSAQYLRHRIPDSMRKRGAANPVRYVP